MTGSPVFFVNFTNRKTSYSKLSNVEFRKLSHAILKRFIDVKFSVWFTLGSENETMFCDS